MFFPVGQVLVGYRADERIVRIAVGQQRTDGEEDFAYGQRRAPVVLEDVETDGALRIDITVVNACLERHLGRLERIVGAEVYVQVEDAAFVDASWRPEYCAMKKKERQV